VEFGDLAEAAYPEEFITPYVRTLIAATRNDRQACHDLSIELGYLTGMESRIITGINARTRSVIVWLLKSYRSGEESMNGSAIFDRHGIAGDGGCAPELDHNPR
jgi:predicted unusual protein kinase regulating ubiquinone biosynthesis (AarF/ABC1/UbiB family)